jgi:predicted nucleic acid-binding protein
MRTLVIDASAAIKLVLEEPGRERVSALISERSPKVTVPWLFWVEIVNSLARRHRWGGHEVLEAVFSLEHSGLTTVPPGRADLLSVIDAVERHGLSSYDASYLALALASDADLVTADRRLAVAAGERGILIAGDADVSGDHRVQESAPAYEARDATWPQWPGAAAYLKQLRRRTRSADRQL